MLHLPDIEQLRVSGLAPGGIRVKPGEQGADATGGQRHTRVGSPVIEVDCVSIGPDGLATWKYNIVHVSASFVWRLRTKHP